MSNSKKVLSNTQLLVMAWHITGGWRTACRSADFILALIVWLLCTHFWMTAAWWDQVTSVLPNVLGFTLGGFAIFLGFGSDSFKRMLAHKDEMRSPYISVSAAFLVFVSLQVMALLYAFVAKSLHFDLPANFSQFKQPLKIADYLASGFGYFLFLYSLTLALRAAMRIFRLSRWYNDLMVVEEAEETTAEKGTQTDSE